MIHHDGMNYALYRIAKDRSEAERIADKIYSGEIDEVGFRKRTRSLYPVCRRYLRLEDQAPQVARLKVAHVTLKYRNRPKDVLRYFALKSGPSSYTKQSVLRCPDGPATHSLRIRLSLFYPLRLVPGSQAAFYSAKLIAGCRPCQGPLLAGWRKIFLPGLTRVYFPHPPCLARPSIPQAEKQSAFGTGLPEGKKRNLNLYRHERNEQDRRNDGRGGNAPGQEIQIHVAGAAAIGLRVLPRFR